LLLLLCFGSFADAYSLPGYSAATAYFHLGRSESSLFHLYPSTLNRRRNLFNPNGRLRERTTLLLSGAYAYLFISGSALGKSFQLCDFKFVMMRLSVQALNFP